jgi:hypothetical protein
VEIALWLVDFAAAFFNPYTPKALFFAEFSDGLA